MKNFNSIDIQSAIISAAAGVVWAFLGNTLYQLLCYKVWMPIIITLLFVGLAIILFLSIVLSNKLHNSTAFSDAFTFKTVIIIISIAVLAFAGEIIYEFEPGMKIITEPTGYVFMIDDSGSMSENDPNGERENAIKSVVSECDDDKKLIVYRFTENIEPITDVFTANTADNQEYIFTNTGNTDILNCLEQLVAEYQNGKFNLGEFPKLILFSDGLSDDSKMEYVTKLLQDSSIPVFAIGCGDADEEYLQKIATSTGGVGMHIDDIADLPDIMKKATFMIPKPNRDLLSRRLSNGKDWIYMIIRMLILLLIGFLFTALKINCFCTKDKDNVALSICILFVIFGTVIIEFLGRAVTIPFYVLRGLYFLSLTILLGTYDEHSDKYYHDHRELTYNTTGDDFLNF